MGKISEREISGVFRKLFVPLSSYANLFCKDVEVSKEIVQDVFMCIWEKRMMHSIDSIESYLFRAVRNRSLNTMRKIRSISIRVTDDFSIDQPDDAVAEVDDFDNLEAAISTLPKRCREIFIMKKIQGMSYREISGLLCVSERTVENQVAIAMKKLRTSLILLRKS